MLLSDFLQQERENDIVVCYILCYVIRPSNCKRASTFFFEPRDYR